MSEHRYPLQALADAMGLSVNQACKHLKLSGGSRANYQANGLAEKAADRLAVKAGLDPYYVWPEMVDDLIASTQRTCAAVDCDDTFTPYTGKNIYCSRGCSRRQGERNRSAANPGSSTARAREWRTSNLDHHRTYNREYQRTYMRRLRARQRREAA